MVPLLILPSPSASLFVVAVVAWPVDSATPPEGGSKERDRDGKGRNQ